MCVPAGIAAVAGAGQEVPASILGELCHVDSLNHLSSANPQCRLSAAPPNGMRVFLKAAHVGRRVVKVLLLSCHYEHVQASASASADRE